MHASYIVSVTLTQCYYILIRMNKTVIHYLFIIYSLLQLSAWVRNTDAYLNAIIRLILNKQKQRHMYINTQLYLDNTKLIHLQASQWHHTHTHTHRHTIIMTINNNKSSFTSKSHTHTHTHNIYNYDNTYAHILYS